MQNLLTLKFWFTLYPPALTSLVSKILLVVFVAVFLVGIIAKIYSIKTKLEKWNRRVIDKMAGLLLTMGAFGLLLFVFAYEQIPILSMRAGYILWLIILGIWIYFLYKFIAVEIPKQRQLKQEREHEDKWLPKPKHK
jgi:amino acid transporter